MASLYSLLSRRELGLLEDRSYWKATRDAEYLVKRLKRTRVLEGHNGCVNTVSWNASGSHLLSGADDCHLNIYDGTTGLLQKSVRSIHQSNIFSAKFLPSSAGYKAVSCAGIGSVEYTEVTPTGDYIGHPFKCQTSITYQVATSPFDCNEFLTCEERGCVRLFDLRVKSSCMCDGCHKDVLYHFPAAVTCMSVHPTSPYYIAFGLGDSTIRVLDRRMVGVGKHCPSSSNPMDLADKTTWRKYRPSALGEKAHKITSVQFNPTGSQLLANYSEDYLYLFNSSLFGCSASSLTKPAYLSQCERFPGKRRNGDTVKRKPVVTTRAVSPSEPGDAPSSLHERPPPMKRLRLRGDWSDTGPEARPETQSTPEGNILMNRMSQMFSQWINMSIDPSGENQRGSGGRHQGRGRRGAERERDNSPLQSSSSDNSFNLFSDSDHDAHSSPVRSRPNTPTDPLPKSQSPHSSNVEEGEPPSSELPPETNTEIQKEQKLLVSAELNSASEQNSSCIDHQASIANSCVVDQPRGTEQAHRDSSTNASSGISVHITEGTDSDDLRSGDEHQGQRSVRMSSKAGEGEEEEEMESSACEREALRGDDFRDLLQPFMVYKGHRNARTMIKQANFWGEDWVMSGSDCGRVFVWNKWTGEVANLLMADSHVVNCIQPHPEAYVIATSGIDYNIKLWEPLAETPCSLNNLEEIMRRNEVMLQESRNTITVPSTFVLRILAYLHRRRRLQGEGHHSDSESD